VVQSDENTEAQRHREFVILSICLQYLTVHPWMMKKVQECGPGAEGVRAIEPLGFLQPNAGARLADSGGGGREEAYIPAVTLRDNTKRPKTLDVGANVLAGADAHQMMERAKRMMQQGNGWRNPFGDGRAGESILEHLRIHR